MSSYTSSVSLHTLQNENGLCEKSGTTSFGGFSTGYVTVTTHSFSSDDEKLETLGNKMQKSTNSRMLQQLDFHTQQIIESISSQDLDPLPLSNNDHTSVLPFEMYVLGPGEPPSHSLNWKPLGFLIHFNLRTNDDRFPLSLWEV